MKKDSKKQIRPKQSQQKQPGEETKMRPRPQTVPTDSSRKLAGKIAIITGGDSGIGKAVALAFAQQGAHLVLSYLNEHQDAETTAKEIKKTGAKVLLMAGDVGDESHCKKIIEETIKTFGKLDILINNAAIHYPKEHLTEITGRQLKKTFGVNVFSQFYLTKAALPHLKRGSAIICTTSVTAYRGSHHLIDYAATKGAIVSFVRSLSASLADMGIRVNGVAPGPIWTPLIPASFPEDHVAKFGSDVPLGRAGEPSEIAPCYVFLASNDGNYMTGQILHPNGGEIING
ncbi:SDR family oxidoreductase [Olivibacter sp. SDN3]|uniref:SDR family oxidoreductase n=1 Tax=Olivibacter sp. SDN3 TaxID=2764720 RepID=UPI001650F32D|nr:SDR family oxidoreductase [Olivibacter sp. SDN3]QNL48359.1 SDR family oxidoreductase [Olivibacter sp. SDN3]